MKMLEHNQDIDKTIGRIKKVFTGGHSKVIKVNEVMLIIAEFEVVRAESQRWQENYKGMTLLSAKFEAKLEAANTDISTLLDRLRPFAELIATPIDENSTLIKLVWAGKFPEMKIMNYLQAEHFRLAHRDYTLISKRRE